MNSQAIIMKEENATTEPSTNGCHELSDEELLALIDTSARKGLGISGDEYLRRLQEGSIERTGPNGYLAYLSMLAALLDY
jgi:hypothetical protein